MATTAPQDVPSDARVDRVQGQWGPLGVLEVFSLRNLIIAAILGALAAAGAAAVAMKAPTVYSSRALLQIDQPTIVLPSPDEGPLRKLSLLRLKYAELAGTPAIAGPAAAQLGIPRAALVASTSVAVPNSALVLTVFGRAHTRPQAERLANALAHSITTYVDNEQQGLNVPTASRYQFNLIQPAEGAGLIQPTHRHALRVGVVFGAIMLVLAYVVLRLLSGGRRWR
jgi:hypothetical protein